MTKLEASKIIGKDYEKINKYKRTINSDLTTALIEKRWTDRVSLAANNPYLLEDTRLQKACFFLASSTLGSNISWSVRDKGNLSIEQGATILDKYYGDKKFAKLLIINKEHPEMLVPILRNKVETESIDFERKVVYENILSSAQTDKKYRGYIDRVFTDLDIYTKVFDSLKEAILLGDSLSEIVYDGNEILDVDRLDWQKILPDYTQKGVLSKWRFLRYVDGMKMQSIGLKPVRVLHFQFGYNDYMGYGLFPLTKNANYYAHMMERLLISSRKARAVQTRVHKQNYENLPEFLKETITELPTDKQIAEYRKKFLDTKITGETIEDVFMPGLWDMKTLDVKGDVFNYTKDVDYINHLFKIGLLIPVGIIDDGSTVDRSTMDIQIKFLKGIAKVLEHQVINNLKHLIKLELHLKGVNLDRIEVDISLDNTGLIDLIEGSLIQYRLRNKNIKIPYSATAPFLNKTPEQLAQAKMIDEIYGLDSFDIDDTKPESNVDKDTKDKED